MAPLSVERRRPSGWSIEFGERETIAPHPFPQTLPNFLPLSGPAEKSQHPAPCALVNLKVKPIDPLWPPNGQVLPEQGWTLYRAAPQMVAPRASTLGPGTIGARRGAFVRRSRRLISTTDSGFLLALDSKWGPPDGLAQPAELTFLSADVRAPRDLARVRFPDKLPLQPPAP